MAKWFVVMATCAGCGFSAASNPDATTSRDGPIDVATIDAMPITADFPITADATIDSQQPDTNFGMLVTLLIDGAGQPATSLVRADLAAIPTAATVTSAELRLVTSADTGDPVQVFEVLEAWDEGQATYNERVTGTAWAGTGATPPSRGATAIAPAIDTSATFAERITPLDIAVVRKWVAQPATNFGAALTMTTGNGATFRTRDDAVAANHPFLRITYVP